MIKKLSKKKGRLPGAPFPENSTFPIVLGGLAGRLIKGFSGRFLANAVSRDHFGTGDFGKIFTNSTFFPLNPGGEVNMTPPAFGAFGCRANVARAPRGRSRMAGDEESKGRKAGKALRTSGIALAIPMTLVSFPLILGFFGKYLADKFGQPWITYVCLLVGLLLGLREAIHMVKRLNDLNR